MSRLSGVNTGRKRVRGNCPTCEQRRRIGDPGGHFPWSPRLNLTEEQRDLLLIAAAEFEDLSEEAGAFVTAIDFIDWVWPPVGSAPAADRDVHPSSAA